jgi:DNA-binding CsgD family transcriptional regulator
MPELSPKPHNSKNLRVAHNLIYYILKLMNQETPTETLKTLVSRLSPEEHEVYLWLRESFSIAWIAETLMRDRRKVKALTKRVYKTLQVRNQEELTAYYGVLDRQPTAAIPEQKAEDLSVALARYNQQTVSLL